DLLSAAGGVSLSPGPGLHGAGPCGLLLLVGFCWYYHNSMVLIRCQYQFWLRGLEDHSSKTSTNSKTVLPRSSRLSIVFCLRSIHSCPFSAVHLAGNRSGRHGKVQSPQRGQTRIVVVPL